MNFPIRLPLAIQPLKENNMYHIRSDIEERCEVNLFAEVLNYYIDNEIRACACKYDHPNFYPLRKHCE